MNIEEKNILLSISDMFCYVKEYNGVKIFGSRSEVRNPSHAYQ